MWGSCTPCMLAPASSSTARSTQARMGRGRRCIRILMHWNGHEQALHMCRATVVDGGALAQQWTLAGAHLLAPACFSTQPEAPQHQPLVAACSRCSLSTSHSHSHRMRSAHLPHAPVPFVALAPVLLGSTAADRAHAGGRRAHMHAACTARGQQRTSSVLLSDTPMRAPRRATVFIALGITPDAPTADPSSSLFVRHASSM